MRRYELVATFALLAAAACDGSDPVARNDHPAENRPNFVIILTDDQRADSVGITGHPFVQTPHLDRLAGEGAVFEGAFVITALCGPSRATLLSGLYTHKSGVSMNGPDLNYDRIPTLPELLQQHGYDTAFIGKYHLGSGGTARPGFGHWVCYNNSAGHGVYIDSPVLVNGREVSTEGYSPDVLSDFAVDWLLKREARPFFLLLFLKNPHVPLTPAPRHADLYREAKVSLPPGFHDPYEDLPALVRATIARREKRFTQNGTRNEQALAEVHRNYARMIPSIDDAVGRIYETLESIGALDRTLLIYTSDNGRLLGEHGLVRKGLPYDPSMQVPLLMRMPGLIKAGARLDAQVLNLDLAPTILDFAGIEIPAEMSGRSVLTLFGDPGAPWREDWLFMSSFAPDSQPDYFAVRGHGWKYNRYVLGELEEQLFDLEEDPHELHNVAADPDRAETLDLMRTRMQQLMKDEQVPREWWTAQSDGKH